MPPKSRKQPVVAQFKWVAIKFNQKDGVGYAAYDLWSWNFHKQKWTRMSNHGCGFSSMEDAVVAAKGVDDESEALFQWCREFDRAPML